MQANLNFTNPLVIHKLYLDDFSNLLDIGPLRGGYRLIKHPHLIGYGIANEAGQVAFWDANGKPFLSYTDLNRWLDDHCPTAKTKPLAPVADDTEPVADQLNNCSVTRRSFLKRAAQAIGLTVVAPILPLSPIGDKPDPNTTAGPNGEPFNSDWGTDHPLDIYWRNKAIGEAIDPARAALIDTWNQRLDDLVGLTWELGDQLDIARRTPAADVDATPVITALEKLQTVVVELASDLECSPAADLIEAITGRPEFVAWIEKCIRNGESWGPADEMAAGEDKWRWLAEIDSVCQNHPEERARLMAAYNARFGGQS